MFGHTMATQSQSYHDNNRETFWDCSTAQLKINREELQYFLSLIHSNQENQAYHNKGSLAELFSELIHRLLKRGSRAFSL